MLEDAITIIPSELETLKGNIAKRYAQEYISQWSNFVQNIKVKTFNNANEGLDVLQVLVDQQQPIMKVIKAIHMNTALLKPEKTFIVSELILSLPLIINSSIGFATSRLVSKSNILIVNIVNFMDLLIIYINYLLSI